MERSVIDPDSRVNHWSFYYEIEPTGVLVMLTAKLSYVN